MVRLVKVAALAAVIALVAAACSSPSGNPSQSSAPAALNPLGVFLMTMAVEGESPTPPVTTSVPSLIDKSIPKVKTSLR